MAGGVVTAAAVVNVAGTVVVAAVTEAAVQG